MKIDSRSTSLSISAPASPSLAQLKRNAEILRSELYETHRRYTQTGSHEELSRQAELSVEYERALHQIRKRMQGRSDGPFGRQ